MPGSQHWTLVSVAFLLLLQPSAGVKAWLQGLLMAFSPRAAPGDNGSSQGGKRHTPFAVGGGGVGKSDQAKPPAVYFELILAQIELFGGSTFAVHYICVCLNVPVS